ncbi:Transcriptional repressor tup12-related protein [Histomonas meleagridis]|uniref:Transcriptional repressor tup12-related protein n=1 Tax=Histomonas meleagridis TaxID=135588 RepID=UPI00355A20CD|nr:Transcriptional repressor tup12-related protein [Histomonas meleagridis]KAH0799795.1 Transcriptional repressor tup12-related protein [Histomonas meleagridis]
MDGKEGPKSEQSNSSNSPAGPMVATREFIPGENSKILQDVYDKIKNPLDCYLQTPPIADSVPTNIVILDKGDDEIQKNLVIIPNNDLKRKPKVNLGYSIRLNDIVCSLSISNDGKYFAYSDSQTVFMMRYQDGALLSNWPIPNDFPKRESYSKVVQFSKDSKYLALSYTKGTIMVLSPESKFEPILLSGHVGQIFSFLFLLNRPILISGGNDGYLCIWNLEKMELIQTIKHRPDEIQTAKSNSHGKIVSLASSIDESVIFVGFLDGKVGMYDSDFKNPITIFEAHDQFLYDISMSPLTGNLATSSADKNIKIWKVDDQKPSCIHILNGHEDTVLSICHSPLQNIIFSGSKDESFKAWDDEKGELLFTAKHHQNTVFQIKHHPKDHSFLTCSGDGLVCCWQYEI